MSLVVTINGKIKPYRPTPVNESLRLRRLQKVAPGYNDLLHRIIEKHDLEKNTEQNQLTPPEKDSPVPPAIREYHKNSAPPKKRYFARDIMGHNVLTLLPEQSVQDALTLMANKKFHHIPIVKEHKIVGIVSDRLLISTIAEGNNKNTTLEKIMISEVLSGNLNTTIADIARGMLDQNISCVPITDDELHLKGIITKSDLLSLLILSFPIDIYS
jgi:CBS domain-containing protein